ncbi:MAG: hypothetical protein IJC16_03150 [Rikenellaceae bacterium]|nr:hypothetical protein [Rikenellaceae bacterium]
MSRSLCLVVILLCCTSCVTLWSRRQSRVILKTRPGPEALVICRGDTALTSNNELELHLPKSSCRDTLCLTIIQDSVRRSLTVRNQINEAYYFNMIGYIGYGLDWLTARNRMYAYPAVIEEYGSTGSTLRAVRKKCRSEKRRLQWAIADQKGTYWIELVVPIVTGCRIAPDPMRPRALGQSGPLGIGASFQWCYRDRRFIALTAVFNPWGSEGPYESGRIPVLNEPSGDRHEGYDRPIRQNVGLPPTLMYRSWNGSQGYVALTHNHVLGRFVLGYGASYTHNDVRTEWTVVDGVLPVIRPGEERYRYGVLGLSLSAGFRLAPKCVARVTYRPGFYRFARFEPWKVEQAVGCELGIRFGLNTKRRMAAMRSRDGYGLPLWMKKDR